MMASTNDGCKVLLLVFCSLVLFWLGTLSSAEGAMWLLGSVFPGSGAPGLGARGLLTLRSRFAARPRSNFSSHKCIGGNDYYSVGDMGWPKLNWRRERSCLFHDVCHVGALGTA